jgi:hypothetical protein
MSCQYSISIAPYQNGVNTTLLPDIGNTPLPPNSDTTGTFNNMTFENGGIDFSGSVGDTCTAGYYVTYTGAILNLENAMNFTIEFPSSTYCLEEGRIQEFPFTTTNTYNYTYFSSISSSIKVTSEQCIYAPAIVNGDCDVCCCGDIFSSCCWDTCNCKTNCADSTYYCFGDPNDGICAICSAEAYVGTVTTKPNPDDITISYVTNNVLPTGYTIVATYRVKLPVGFRTKLTTLYFYNFDVKEMNVSIQQVNVSGIVEPPDGWNVAEFNSEFNSLVAQYLVPYLNTLVNKQAFEFQLEPSQPVQ